MQPFISPHHHVRGPGPRLQTTERWRAGRRYRGSSRLVVSLSKTQIYTWMERASYPRHVIARDKVARGARQNGPRIYDGALRSLLMGPDPSNYYPRPIIRNERYARVQAHASS